jgi:hypothetical protein
MGSVTRNVADINPADRQALEHVIGEHLSANQQIIISVVNIESSSSTIKPIPLTAPLQLPDWCNVYEGMTDVEVAEIETSIVREPGGRTFS